MVAEHRAADQNLPQARTCGTCSLCCKVLDIDALHKPAHRWCEHYVKGGGCGIYDTRPDVCRGFQCRWLYDPSLGDEWKPARSKFVLSETDNGVGLWVSVDLGAPLAWRQEPFYSQIKKWSEIARTGSGYVGVRQGERSFIVFPEEELEIFEFIKGSSLKVGYQITGNLRRPLAMVRAPDGSIRRFVGGEYRQPYTGRPSIGFAP